MKLQEEEKTGFSRRDFFKTAGIAGLAAGAVGAGAVLNPKEALAAGGSNSLIMNMTIRELNEPPYNRYPYADADKLKRYHQRDEAFKNRELAQKNFGGGEWRMIMEESLIKKIKADIPAPGYSLADMTLANVAWASYRSTRFYDWGPLGVANTKRLEFVGKWQGSPEENNRIIKKAGYLYGAGQVGVTELKEQWVYASAFPQDTPIVFSAAHDKPVKEEDAWYIPKTMKTAVVVVVPHYFPLSKYSPSGLASAAVGDGYSQMAECAGKIAEFIRGLGYNAFAMGNEVALSVPLAIDAGLGELGRHGLLINPIYGSWIRIDKVFTDMPIAPDKPIEFGAARFCRTCMKCAELCPSKSISFDRDTSHEVQVPSNNPGMKKWYVNTWTCLTFWTQNGTDCSVCQAVCPYSKPQTWIHDLVKGISARTSLLNGTFARMDDLFGYGTTVEDRDPRKWWRS